MIKISVINSKCLSHCKYSLIAFFLLLLFFQTARAQDPTPRLPTDDEVNRIARQIYCPICENTPLDVCPTQACAEWRDLIREKLAEDWSDEQIIQYFIVRFGDRVLATPPARGLNLLVYFVPVAAFLTGTFLLIHALSSWNSFKKRDAFLSQTDNSHEETSIDEEFRRKLEEELRDY